MTLEELARQAPFEGFAAVPDWTLGCWRRRCITYADGREDTDTAVVWVQSRGLTGDLRIPAGRPSIRGRAGLDDFDPAELARLACVEGGVADTQWADGRMAWENWSAFQPYDKWPEPGLLRRVGTCLLEQAPSGIYVEDWRLQEGSSGLLAGLRLLEENGRARSGGLVVAGRHVLFTLGRFDELPDPRPAQGQLALGAARVFEAEASYCRRQGDACEIVLSTNPFLEGATAPLLHGFEPAGEGLLRQRVGETDRLWRTDSLLPEVEMPLSTPASPEGQAWLSREMETRCG